LGFPDNPGTDQLTSAFSALITLEVSTAPYGTSTGGLTFTFDHNLGTFTRSARTFGPSFAERSLTTGARTISVGFNSLHATYDSLAGQNLRNGDLALARNGINPFGPIVAATEKVNLSSQTTVAFANYGVTNDLDVGLAVPWVRISVGSEISLLSSSGVNVTAAHPLTLPQTSASGIGDVAILGKYRLWHNGQTGISAGIAARLPTGDANELRGTGVTRTLVSAIWSRAGKVSPHVNIGYEFWSAAVPISPKNQVSAKNQLLYVAGAEVEAHPRLTIIMDLIGRRLGRGGALGYQRVDFATPLPASADVLLALPKGFNVLSLAPGIKWNLAGNILLVGNVLVALANNGLRANVIPAFGLDWTF
jgi:hypothetical protein